MTAWKGLGVVQCPHRRPGLWMGASLHHEQVSAEWQVSVPLCAGPAVAMLQVFGVAFRRNARWSTNQPVPELGDETTPLDKVCG